MEKYYFELEKSLDRLKSATQILTEVYPNLNEGKLLLSVFENVHEALHHLFLAVFVKEKKVFEGDFSQIFEEFLRLFHQKYQILSDDVEFVWKIINMKLLRVDSPVEFSRPGKFVICSSNYETLELSTDELQTFIFKAKSLIIFVKEKFENV